jgi:epsilon-lactone hydrolase
MTSPTPRQPYVNIPDTVSPQAQAFLRTLQDPALLPRFPDADDFAGWEQVRAAAEVDGLAKSAPLLERFPHTVVAATFGGVPVLDIRPERWRDNGKAIVYTHGGAHVMYSAASTLGRAVMAAHDTQLPVISIDYTVAPLANCEQITDQLVRAVEGLMASGQPLADTAIYGDSSGGGLAAATVLKMRDRGLGMPAVAALVSPWVDITPSGDTEVTLLDADANQRYANQSVYAAAAYAALADQKRPYASPVYGDFSAGFPPTLIQGGLKETLLSGFVRMYQALDTAGQIVKLDLYEGMPHNFQDRIPDAPESLTARGKFRCWLHQYLGVPEV